jgi:hypothetical protein
MEWIRTPHKRNFAMGRSDPKMKSGKWNDDKLSPGASE